MKSERVVILAIFSVILTAGAVSVGGCGGSAEVKRVQPPKKPVPAPAVSKKQTPAGAVKKEPEKPLYRYDRFNKVDPFEPILRIGPSEEKIPTNPLEKFDIHELKVKAIVYDPRNPMAVIEDPEGQTYIVKRGMKIGRADGTITRISRDKIYVLEKYEDIFGNVRTNEVVLSIEEE